MGKYKGSFGLTRYLGVGEGRDVKYDASHKPSLGLTNFIEVVVDEHGPVANDDGVYANGQACIPAGAVVTDAYVLTDVKGAAAGVTIDLVKKDGTGAVALFSAFTPAGDNSADNADGAALQTRVAEAMYVKAGGTRTGMKAKLVIEYI